MAAKRGTNVDEEIDALFRLPLTDFTTARNALASRLKKAGRAIEAERVKSLAKPPAPAWAVNQLYWQNPKAIEQLIAATERIRKAQTGRSKNADLRELLAEKKQMMAGLTEKASAILSEAGHAASLEAMRRVSATLEALAVWGKTVGAPEAGRLTVDLDPPGFEALAATMGGAKITPAKLLAFRAPKAVEDPAAAREAVKSAEKRLRDARREAERAQAALTKADARTAAVEKQKQEIDARYAEAREEARAASSEAKNAAQAVADAERSLARAKEALG